VRGHRSMRGGANYGKRSTEARRFAAMNFLGCAAHCKSYDYLSNLVIVPVQSNCSYQTSVINGLVQTDCSRSVIASDPQQPTLSSLPLDF